MSQYFPKPYEPFGGDINVKVDLSIYATKSDFKNISHIDVISCISRLATSSALTVVENKIPDVSGLATTSALAVV